ncbi:Glycosyl transferase family 2 [Selenomonas ruminantium]|uniref:Glycosyl transferase family 2 n=1 Tax=Selenomonas ruminantium TaxID=971 RepID=A0A1M6UME0_SELRU|nr:glycosyltransferase [Selenomonas ruminantium]SHK70303.1 Glycosyl transferase family 2 [Selenomonas ruminantium]
MKIVGCYIVRDEAEALQRSLDSIKGQTDEIVIVDTGSQDNTLEIARAANAKVYHFSWRDDFAAARNFALDKLQGDWVIFLDADEYFHADTVMNLRPLIMRQPENTNLLLVRRQDVDAANHVMMALYVPRIFRIRTDLRYTGAIHEELRQAGAVVQGVACVAEQELLLVHTGYAGELGPAKARRNLDMLQKSMEKSSHPESYYGYLAEAYDGMEDIGNAMKYAYLDIARGRQAETYASRSYRLLLEKLAENKRDCRERQRIAKLAIRDFPELPEFHAELAESLAAGWQYVEAAKEMKRAGMLGQDYHGMEPSVFSEELAAKWQERGAQFSRLAEIGEQLSITACVIVRNEEQNISSWLVNAGKYASQRIVLDTGSTDRTCEFAVEAELHHYIWQEDFAAARNEALQYVRGDWVAFLDADEYFSHPEQVRGFLAYCEVTHPEAEAVRVTITNVDADDGYREISHFCNVRLFRNKATLRYRGRVHENLFDITGKSLTAWEEPGMEVIHTGYSSSVILEKTERNLALLLQDKDERGMQPEHFRYLADCYYTLGEYQQAEFYALQAIEAPLQGKGTQGDMYYMVLLCMKALSDPLQDRLDFAVAASKKFPSIPDFAAVQGLLYYELEQYDRAVELLERACHLSQHDEGRESSAFGDIQAMVYAVKADCERKQGKWEMALQDSRTAMGLDPREEVALEIFCELRQAGDSSCLIEELQAYFTDTVQDLWFLARFSERNGFGPLYMYYHRRLQEKGQQEPLRQEYYELLQSGEWSQLVEKLQAGLAADVELMIALLLRLQGRRGHMIRQVEQQLFGLLPQALQECWQQLSKGEDVRDWSVYKILWNYVLTYGTDEQIVDFAGFSRTNKDLWLQLTRDMMRQEKWQSAFALLSQVPQEEADGAFWQAAGQCLYHLGEYSGAWEAFDHAREAGGNTLLMKSYQKWLEKNKKNA